MAKVLIPTQVLSRYGVPDEVDWTAANATDDHYFVNTGNEILLMKNADSGAHTATIVSVADPEGRTGDQTITCAAGAIQAAGPFATEAYNQPSPTAGQVFVTLTADTDVSFALLQIARV